MSRRPVPLTDLFDAEDPYTTEFRRLLHQIGTLEGAEKKLIMVTSAMLSEGKSTITSFMAMTAARNKGMRTLLVDCDLRRPTLHTLFAVPRENGLTEVLSNQLPMKNAIRKTALEKLDLLTAGSRTAVPSDVFDVEGVGKLLEELRFYYDIILLDSPPVLPVSDPMLLATKVDGVLVVIKAGTTQKEIVQRTLDIMGGSREKILGIVMNNMDETLPYYYNYSYYGYSSGDSEEKSGGSRPGRPPRAEKSPSAEGSPQSNPKVSGKR